MTRVNQYRPDFAIVWNGSPFITEDFEKKTLFTLGYAMAEVDNDSDTVFSKITYFIFFKSWAAAPLHVFPVFLSP